MDRLGDDELASVLKWIHNSKDRNSFSFVCKQWCRVEGSNRSSLRVFEPQILHHFLPRFPNLLKFQSSEKIPNHQMDFLAKTCPNIQELDLSYHEKIENFDEFLHPDDFDDTGISAIAISCYNLSSVSLKSRFKIGNPGIFSLVNFSQNLVNLNLGYCSRINDEALEAIGILGYLKDLNLQGCCLITDLGLDFLVKGNLRNTLEVLVIGECDRITDNGLMSLTGMKSLVVLNLGECGPRITDIGGKAIANIKTLKRLNLSWLINVSNDTVSAIAKNCKNIMSLDLTGCEMVSGDGICSLAILHCLNELKLAHIASITATDLQYLLLRCESLRSIQLDQRMRMWIPASFIDFISKRKCGILWRS
ncbi:hypothetical protein M9H77_19145 [Catharanthus roseus]|uniref:Uncharacterized protein n=1 Tax=Catharanthus roseus TaxID=4058 RepID=A0ACC0B9L4_CATRO|nr:hypothetical protein M9H77_19145 [Catharanthus roseus]